MPTSRAFWSMLAVILGDSLCYFAILSQLPKEVAPAFMIMVSLLTFVGGFFSDRFGVRRTITAALIALFMGRSFMLLGTTLLWPALVLMALAEAILQPALFAGMKEYSSSKKISMAYGLLYAVMNLGVLAGGFLLPWGANGVFGFAAGSTAVMLGVHFSVFTNKVDHAEHNINASSTRRGKIFPILDLRFMSFIFILLPVRTLFAHQWLTLPDSISKNFSKEVGDKFNSFNSITPFLIVLGVPLFIFLTRKTKILNVITLGTFISAMSCFILIPSASAATLITYCLLFALGEILWAPRFLEYVANISPNGQIGAYMGLAGLPWFLAKITTSLSASFMLEKFPATLWLIYGWFALITPFGLLLGKKWFEGKRT